MHKSFNVGSGVSTTAMRNLLFDNKHTDVQDTDAASAEQESSICSADGTVYELNSLGQPEWASTPTVEGQYKKDKMWKYGPYRADVFKLESAKMLEDYNKLLARACAEDPSVYIIHTEQKFFNGNFVLLVTWCPIMYRVLIRKK